VVGFEVVEGATDVEEVSLPPLNLGDFGFGTFETALEEEETALRSPTVIVEIVLRFLSLPRNRFRRLETTSSERRTGVAEEGVTEIEAETIARFSFGFEERRDRRWRGEEGGVTAERFVFGLATTGRERRSTGGGKTDRFAFGFLTVAGKTTTGERFSSSICCCCCCRFARR